MKCAVHGLSGDDSRLDCLPEYLHMHVRAALMHEVLAHHHWRGCALHPAIDDLSRKYIKILLSQESKPPVLQAVTSVDSSYFSDFLVCLAGVSQIVSLAISRHTSAASASQTSRLLAFEYP